MASRRSVLTGLALRAFGPWTRGVDRGSLKSDALAGLLGALLVLPQGIAFARLAGLPPEFGLYTAIVPCAIAALLGSSRHVVSGPTNANSLALLAVLSPLALAGSPAYIQLVLTVTLLVGAMQALIGFLRLGSIANLISPSALHGFMGGAAILIVVHAATEFLGLEAPPSPDAGMLAGYVVDNAVAASPAAIAVALVTVATVLGSRRLVPRWPAMLVGLVVATLLALAIDDGLTPAAWGQVSILGSLPAIWPRAHWPAVEWRTLPELVGIAFALTIVALGQSISIAKAVGARSGQRIDANREFAAQGVSNLVGGCFSCYVSCGSLNRSLPNLEAGARTPLAAVFASAWLLLLLALVGRWLALIPMPAIAALLMLVAWSLFDWRAWRRLWSESRPDFAIAAVTGAAAVTMRLEMAILLGTLMSLTFYLHRTTRPTVQDVVPERGEGSYHYTDSSAAERCPQLRIVRVNGSIFFGAVDHVQREFSLGPARPQKHLLVIAGGINFVDVAGAKALGLEARERRQLGGALYFYRLKDGVARFLDKARQLDDIGRDRLFPVRHRALATIYPQLDPEICRGCRVRLFDECQEQLPSGERRHPALRA